jgi:hypothetical protein
MPSHLSNKDIEGIIYVFSKMSTASKNDFIANLMISETKHYAKIVDALGLQYSGYIAQA